MISIQTVDMSTDSNVTADKPSQFLGKHSFVFVCVSIICNWIRTEHNLFISFNTMPIGKASGYLISNVVNILSHHHAVGREATKTASIT